MKSKAWKFFQTRNPLPTVQPRSNPAPTRPTTSAASLCRPPSRPGSRRRHRHSSSSNTPTPTTPQQPRAALRSRPSLPSPRRRPSLAQCNPLVHVLPRKQLKQTIMLTPSRRKDPLSSSNSSNVSAEVPLFRRSSSSHNPPFRQAPPPPPLPPLLTSPNRSSSSALQLSSIRPIVILPRWTRPIVRGDQRSCVLRRASEASLLRGTLEADLR